MLRSLFTRCRRCRSRRDGSDGDSDSIDMTRLTSSSSAASQHEPTEEEIRQSQLDELTPEELLLCKLDAKQYEEAFAHARQHSLPLDIIYQTQWNSSRVSSHTLQSYLAPIIDEWWILQSLVDRLYDSEDVESGLLLMQFGLDVMTTKEKIRKLEMKQQERRRKEQQEEKETERKRQHQQQRTESERKEDDDDTASSASATPSAAATSSASLAAPPAVSSEYIQHRSLILHMYRLMFLHYRDRLRTFSLLHHSAPPSVALNHLTYTYFLDCDLRDAARMLAEEEQYLALSILFRHHYEELWMERDDILAAIPEATRPTIYVELMPMPGVTREQFMMRFKEQQESTQESDDHGSLLSSSSSSTRQSDWIEDISILTSTLEQYQSLHHSAFNGSTIDLSFDPDVSIETDEFILLQRKLHAMRLISSYQFEYTPTQIKQFYLNRVADIDSRSGLLNYAVELLEYARDQLDVSGFDSTLSVLQDLILLVYTYNLDYLSYRDYSIQSDFERLCLVLRTTTPNTIVEDLQKKARMFFVRNGKAEERKEDDDANDPFILSSETSPLLRQYLLYIAPTRLDLVHAIVSAATKTHFDAIAAASSATSSRLSSTSSSSLLTNTSDLLSITIECCYASDDTPDADTLNTLMQIYECVQQFNVSGNNSDDPRLLLLSSYLNLLHSHLTSTKILLKYQQARSMLYLLVLYQYQQQQSPSDNSLPSYGPLKRANEELQRDREKWSQIHPSLRRSLNAPASLDTQTIQLYESLARKYMKQHRQTSYQITDTEWTILLTDMNALWQQLYSFVDRREIYKIWLKCVMTKERWSLCKRVLVEISKKKGTASSNALSTPSAEGLFTPDEIDQFVIDQAKDFLNSSPSIQHHLIEQAETCLNLLPLREVQQPQHHLSRSDSTDSDVDSSSHALLSNQLSTDTLTREWQSELNLIHGIQRLEKLGGGFQDIVPIEIRVVREREEEAKIKMTKEKEGGMKNNNEGSSDEKTNNTATSLDASSSLPSSVLSLLLRSSPQFYQRLDDVIDITRVLGSSSDDAQIDVKLQLIETAMQHGDHRTGLKIMLNLMEDQLPSTSSQKQTASRLCYQLSQQLNTTNAPSMSTSLVKPKLHLLAHSMWSCQSDEELDKYLEEFKQLSIKKPASVVANRRDESDEKKYSMDDEEESKQQHRSRTSSFTSLANNSRIFDGDDSDEMHTDVERLIMSAYQEDGVSKRNNAPDLLALTYHQQQEPTDSKNNTTSIDSALLELISRSCSIDSSLALSYLLSLSTPSLARSLLDSKVSDESNLSRAEKQETVELGMRYYAIVTLLAEQHPKEVIDRIEMKLVSSSHPNRKSSTNSITLPSSVITKWEIPSHDVLQDGSFDLLQSYVDALSSAYDDLSNDTLTKPDSLISCLHYNTLRLESKKSEFILVHCPNLDHARFARDEEYRRESIMQLARGNQEEDESGDDGEKEDRQDEDNEIDNQDRDNLSSRKMFDISISLSKRYHLPLHDLYLQRLSALFTRHTSIPYLKASIARMTEQLMMDPIATYQTVTNEIWKQTQGDDLVRLLVLFDLCLSCFESLLTSYTSTAPTFASPNKKKNLMIYEVNVQRLKDLKEVCEKVKNIIQTASSTHQQPSTTSSSLASVLLMKASPLRPSNHVNIVPSFSSSSMNVDYKLLLSTPSSSLLELRKLLTEQNLFLVSRLCSKINDIMSYSQRNQGSIFPHVQQPKNRGVSGVNVGLTEIFVEPPQSATLPLFTSSPAQPSIDSSIVFLLFLSKSLRKHMDTIWSLQQSRPASSSSSSTSPSIQSWFTNYDQLLKRLSIPSFVQLITECVYEDQQHDLHHDKSSTANPQQKKGEIQLRLEVVQAAMRLIETIPAWTGVSAASSSSNPSIPAVQRSLSTDFDSSLPLESKLRYYDDLVSCHTYICILLGMIDLLHAISGERQDLWRRLIKTKGESEKLEKWVKEVLVCVVATLVSSSSSQLQSSDLTRLLQVIRIQKDSAEYKSAEMQSRVSEEEKRFDWSLFKIMKECVEDNLVKEKCRFVPARLSEITALGQLVRPESYCAVASSSQPHLTIIQLLTHFPSLLKEEQSIELFQMLLQFISAPAIDGDIQLVRVQLHVATTLNATSKKGGTSSTKANANSSNPFAEQLTASQALISNLQQSLMVHLLVHRCLNESSSSSSSRARQKESSVSHVATQLLSSKSRSNALKQLLPSISSDNSDTANQEVAMSIAALLVILTTSVADDSVWFAFLSHLQLQECWSLLLAFYTQHSLTSSLITSQLSFDQQTTIYRTAFSQSPSKLLAIQLGLSSSPSSKLPERAVQHLVALCYSEKNLAELKLNEEAYDNILKQGFLMQTFEQPLLFQALMKHIVRQFRSSSDAGDDVGIGSFSHSLALLVCNQHYAHALALFSECHQTHSSFLSSSSDAHIDLRLMKSCLQQAKGVCQQKHVDATDETEATQIGKALQTYGEALAAI